MLTKVSRETDFPSLGRMVYLNTAAEGISPRPVEEAIAEYSRDKRLGMDGREQHYAQWEAAKAEAARMFGLEASEVSICSCTSEAFNLLSLALKLRPGDEVVINDLDFPSGATPWLQEACPARTRVWRSRDGALRVDDLIPLLGPRTRLVTVSRVSFYNGFTVALPELVGAVRAHSPALLSVDVTQALGRIPLDLAGVDFIVSSTHKWILSSHGGGLVGVPSRRAEELTVSAGGWFNLEDAFGAERFEKAVSKPGAAGFSVGMPNFPAVYATRAALAYIRSVGVEAIDRYAKPLVRACFDGLKKLPVQLITPDEPGALAGILAFKHPKASEIGRFLREKNVHIMEHAGRLRVAIHGYNTLADVDCLLETLKEALSRV